MIYLGAALIGGGLAALGWLVSLFARAQYVGPPPGAPAGPAELRIDTTTGSHDELPIREDVRATLAAYCEQMWQHTLEQP
ncbi:hypothetical protein [Micromonospora marina]|uniref:hypothetical protein n=1 Tax=Micromonospora marina TaxID=307120 RepID=UPI003452EE90